MKSAMGRNRASQFIAQHLSEIMAINNIILHGWHIKGTSNWLADQLSCNKEMTNLIYKKLMSYENIDKTKKIRR